MYENHGTMRTYRKGCACALCRGTNAAYQRDYQERRKKKLNKLKIEAEIAKEFDASTAPIKP